MAFFTAPFGGNTDAIKLFRFPVPGLETLSEEERIIIGQLTLIRSVSLENAWEQFNLGMIPEETIETTESRMISMYDNCKRRSANCLQTGNRSTSTKSTMKKLSLDEILQSVGVLSVVASLIFVGLELRQGNLLAQMEASDRAYQGSVASREMQLLYTKEWLEGATNDEEITDETISDERFRLMCSNVVFNLSNNWEQDALSENADKMNYRLLLAENLGGSVCWNKFNFRGGLLARGELYTPLIQALDRGASGWKEERQ